MAHHLRSLDKSHPRRQAALYTEGQQAGCTRHLGAQQRVLRVRGEAGIVDIGDAWVAFKERRNGERILIVFLHAQRQRLHALQYLPRTGRA